MSDVETFYCLIVGSRSFSDYELFVAKCDLLLRNWGSVVIVSGGARGADALAKRYAVDRGYCYMEFPADWDTYGRRAGYIRNITVHRVHFSGLALTIAKTGYGNPCFQGRSTCS